MKKTKTKQIGLFLLDKSGSMSTLRDATISGYNEYLHKLQTNKVDVAYNLVLFDDVSIDKPYIMTPIKEVQPLNQETYVPNGLTPLYDSAVDAIEELVERVSKIKGKVSVSVVIMTDGMENASRRHTEKCLRELIQKLEAKGNWTFAYMGANQDSYVVASSVGISRGNTMNWDSNNPLQAFASMAIASVRHVNMMNLSTNLGGLSNKNFFAGGEKA